MAGVRYPQKTTEVVRNGSLIRRATWTAELARLPWQWRFPFESEAAIHSAQARRVTRAVGHAYAHVPYYRETMDRLGLRPTDFRTAADLAKLPLIERDQLARDPEYFVSRAEPIDSYVKVRTSASTGHPLVIYRDPRAMFAGAAHAQRWRAVFRELGLRRFRYRAVDIFTPTSVTRTTDAAFRRLSLIPPALRTARTHASLYDPAEANVRLINDFRADVVGSYGSYIEALFRHVHETGTRFHAPKIVVYGGDALPDSARRLITDRFGSVVLSVYGAIEAPGIGFECGEHLGHHHNIDLYPARIVDESGDELPDGESGDVVVSNLVNRGTMLLNYRVGDIAAKLPNRCPCGRSLPMLSYVEGRTDDWLQSPMGEIVHPQAVMKLISAEDEVTQVQVVQEASRNYRVSVVPRPERDREEIRARLTRRFADRLGEGANIEVAFVDSVQRTEAGKVRAVISAPDPSRFSPAPR